MIKLAQISRATAVTLMVVGLGFSSVANAQDVSKAQIKAARGALDALKATAPFDNILPQIAERLKATLIQASPNYQDIITSTVDAKALTLAGRRSDLENEVAAIYAKTFSVDDLNAFAKFFSSPAGKKFLKDAPIANRQMYKAADIWGAGIERDLASASDAELDKIVGATAKTAAPAKKQEKKQ